MLNDGDNFSPYWVGYFEIVKLSAAYL
jgi:hypothetical protein